MADELRGDEAPRKKISLVIRIPQPTPNAQNNRLSSKDVLRELGKLQAEIAEAMVALGTKDPNAVISVEFGFDAEHLAVESAEASIKHHSKRCMIAFDCNGL